MYSYMIKIGWYFSDTMALSAGPMSSASQVLEENCRLKVLTYAFLVIF